MPCKGQMTTFCCGRAHLLPQRWQSTLVPAGFTSTTRRPASAALPVRMLVNWAQPASRIAFVQPGLRGSPVRQEGPCLARVGLGYWTSGHSGRVQVLQRDHVTLVDQRPRCFVVEVAAPVADLAPLRGQRPPDPLAVPRPRPGAGLAALQLRDHLRRRRQESRIGDHLAVAGGQEPGHAQINADLAPGGGNGTGSVWAITMTYQRRCSRLSWSALTVPRTSRCWRTLTDPLPGNWHAPTCPTRTAATSRRPQRRTRPG